MVDKPTVCPYCNGDGCVCACHEPVGELFGIEKEKHSQFDINVSDKEFEEILDELDEE